MQDHSAFLCNNLNHYHHAPDAEIKQAIYWIDHVRFDCQRKISELQGILQSRQRARRYRDEIDALALELYDDDHLNISRHQLALIVMQRLGCSWNKAFDTAGSMRNMALQKHRTERDKQIRALHRTGEYTKAHLARKYDISRQQVYNIVQS